jgi:hypothetical protein
MSSIFKSRKFWIMVCDTVVSLVTYFVGRYLNPASVKDILFLIGALQPVILLVIASIAVQNVEGIKAQADQKVAGIKAQADIEQSIIYQEKAVPQSLEYTAEPVIEPVK